MNKLELVKQKLIDMNKREKELALREAIANNNIEILKQLADKIKEKTDSENETAKEINELIKQITKLEQKKSFDQEAFQKVSQALIDVIVNKIQATNEIPISISYVFNDQESISRVIETYENYKIIQEWSYDGRGNLIGVKNIKKNNA